ncbi:polysaccharide biosynthesis protein [Streptomyces sp. 4F14]|uniref:polysaccharide biosynthesis protein n=1 Tax=Streptomyces sp. 4F14 TaxID=3394380 RepID=UPI003A8419AC
MSDETIRLATVGRILRRRGRLLALLAVVGALLGYGVCLVFPPRYTTSASVLLPGAWEERELLTQAQIATSSVVVDRAAATLAWKGVDGADLKGRVGATAADGNIVKISGTAETPRRAQQLADQVAQQFVTFAARVAGENADPEAASGPEELRQLVVQTGRRITELADAAGTGQSVESVQTRTELTKLRTALQEAVTELNRVSPAGGKAAMVVMGPAPRPDGEASPTRLQLTVGGGLLFFLFAVIGHLTAARMSRRLRTEAEIAAALGSPLLGTVDVPAGARVPGSRGRGLRRLLGLDVRWDVPPPQPSGDETDRRIRHRRVCARVREQLPFPRSLLVVVPEGDAAALGAAGLLVTESEGDPQLRVAEVLMDRPVVPDRDTESGVLVVVGPGEWTAAELAGVAEACADAGHTVVGVVLAATVTARTARSADRRPKVLAVGGTG